MTSEIADLLERFRRGAELVAAATTGASSVELDFQPGPGQWSVRQIVCHLADAEAVAVDRLRRTIAEPDPRFFSFDEGAWAANLDYGRRRISQALDTFRTVRADNHELLKGLPEETFARTCSHNIQGALTLKDLLRIYAEHAESHARQILEVRRKYKESRATA